LRCHDRIGEAYLQQSSQVPSTTATMARYYNGRKVGPNESCPCGSGKKFKRCHRDVPVVDPKSPEFQEKAWALFTANLRPKNAGRGGSAERRLVDVFDVGGHVKELARDVGDLDRVLDRESTILRHRRRHAQRPGETPRQRAHDCAARTTHARQSSAPPSANRADLSANRWSNGGSWPRYPSVRFE
jgi:hypothetical protein